MTNENENKNNMKSEILSKAQCMLDTYSEILGNTKEEIDSVFHSDAIDNNEILKRTDMFFNLALQRVEKDIATPNRIASNIQNNESPCAKKAREKEENK